MVYRKISIPTEFTYLRQTSLVKVTDTHLCDLIMYDCFSACLLFEIQTFSV